MTQDFFIVRRWYLFLSGFCFIDIFRLCHVSMRYKHFKLNLYIYFCKVSSKYASHNKVVVVLATLNIKKIKISHPRKEAGVMLHP